MGNNDQITALAREYAEGEYKTLNLPTDHTEVSAYRYMDFVRFLLRRFCLVEKPKAAELCRLTLAHGDSVDYGLIDGLTDIVCELFPEQYEQEARNPDLGKEVEG